MHLRGVINGTLKDIMEWNQDFSAQFTDFQMRDGKNAFEGDLKKFKLRLGIRYTIPVDITFPKENLDFVLNLMKPQLDYKSKEGKILSWARKLMGLKKIEEWEKKPCLFDNLHAIQFKAIGLKDDNFKNGVEMI